MNKAVLLSGLVTGILAISPGIFARGGSSVAGPGTPEFKYSCYELDYVPNSTGENPPSFEASIGAFWPNYDLTITVIDRNAGTLDSEMATEVPPSSIGGALTYSGDTYSLEIGATTTPIEELGHTYSASTLSRFGLKVRELKCEYVGE